MQVNHDFDISLHRIKSYSKGEIEVVLPIDRSKVSAMDENGMPVGPQIAKLTSSAIIMPDKLIKEWPVTSIDALAKEHVEQLVTLKPEVVLIGTGEKLIWPNRALLAPLTSAHIGYEIMDTAAACRTYNILSHEGRDVAAALLMI